MTDKPIDYVTELRLRGTEQELREGSEVTSALSQAEIIELGRRLADDPELTARLDKAVDKQREDEAAGRVWPPDKPARSVWWMQGGVAVEHGAVNRIDVQAFHRREQVCVHQPLGSMINLDIWTDDPCQVDEDGEQIPADAEITPAQARALAHLLLAAADRAEKATQRSG